MHRTTYQIELTWRPTTTSVSSSSVNNSEVASIFEDDHTLIQLTMYESPNLIGVVGIGADFATESSMVES